MSNTPNLDLPYILPAQAQKHVTHNEALRALDVIVQIGVLDRTHDAPPASPVDGDRYLVATPASGAWLGESDHIAAWQDGAWAFYTPRAGWLAWVADEEVLLVWDGAAWTEARGAAPINPAPLVGVNTTADTTNRLAAKSDAVLLSHDDVTPGSGDVRVKVNKSAASKTASHLFQTGFSGRAEFGLTGDDDFHVKVSPDGSTWREAIVVNKSTGAVAFPNTTIGGGGSTFTSPVVIDTATADFFTHDGSDHASYDGYDFGFAYGPGPWTNGPVSEPSYKNNVWTLGFNMAGTSGRADASKPRLALHWETKFYNSTSQTSPYSEWHLQYFDVAGVVSRPISWIGQHDGTYSEISFNNDRLVIGSRTATALLQVDAATKAITLRSDTYLTASNATGSQVEVRSATSAITLPLKVTNPSGGAAGVDLQCGSGASLRRASFVVDSSQNIVCGQSDNANTGASVFFDTNNAFIVRSRTNSFAQLVNWNNTVLTCNRPLKLPSYTVAGLPSASAAGAGAMVYVSNASGGPTIACSDGSAWKVAALLGATVS